MTRFIIQKEVGGTTWQQFCLCGQRRLWMFSFYLLLGTSVNQLKYFGTIPLFFFFFDEGHTPQIFIITHLTYE